MTRSLLPILPLLSLVASHLPPVPQSRWPWPDEPEPRLRTAADLARIAAAEERRRRRRERALEQVRRSERR